MPRLPDNPSKLGPTSAPNPATLSVIATRRPTNVSDLVSHTEVLYNDWENDVGVRRLYYLDGIVSFMRLFDNSTKISFLKKQGFLEQAAKIITRETDWPTQAHLNWSEGTSNNQLRSIRNKEPVAFTKIVQTIVACELAIKSLRRQCSPYWVYDYMRVIPSVYNIDKFSDKTVAAVRKIPNAASQLRLIAGQNAFDVLVDLANGHCITAATADDIAEYVTASGTDPDCAVGPVRFKPGKKRLGRGPASENEDVLVR